MLGHRSTEKTMIQSICCGFPNQPMCYKLFQRSNYLLRPKSTQTVSFDDKTNIFWINLLISAKEMLDCCGWSMKKGRVLKKQFKLGERQRKQIEGRGDMLIKIDTRKIQIFHLRMIDNWIQFQYQRMEKSEKHLQEIKKKYAATSTHFHTPNKLSQPKTQRKSNTNIQIFSLSATPGRRCKNDGDYAKIPSGKIRKNNNKPLKQIRQDRYCNTASNFYANKHHDKFSTISSKEFKIYEHSTNLQSNHSKNDLKLKVDSLLKQTISEKNSQYNSKNLSIKPSTEILGKKQIYSSSKCKKQHFGPNYGMHMRGVDKIPLNLDSNTCIKNVESVQERIKSILWQK